VRSCGSEDPGSGWLATKGENREKKIEIYVQRMGMFERARSSRKVLERSSTRTTRKVFRSHRFLLLVSFVFILTVPLLQWFLSFPPPLFDVKPSSSSSTCSDGQFNGYVVNKHSVCTDSCGKICFPRVHGMCVSRKQVTICEDQQPLSQEIVDAGGGLPDVLRLITHVPRARVPVKRGNCPGWDSRSHEPYTSPGDFPQFLFFGHVGAMCGEGSDHIFS
jgi:hypothetical protein